MELVATGYCAEAGSRLIYGEESRRAALSARYAPSYFRCFAGAANTAGSCGFSERTDLRGFSEQFSERFSKAREKGLAVSCGEGGIYTGLWRLLKQNRCGAVYSQRAIPILQETIELCEFFDLNPYRLYAAGCMLWLTDTPGELMLSANEAGLVSAQIGFTQKGQAIRRIDCPQTAFLRRPEPDELLKLGLSVPRNTEEKEA